MEELTIKAKLEKLTDFHAVKNQLERMKEEAKAQILTPELLQQLKDIDDEYQTQFEGVDANISDLEKEIKADVITHGETVKGDFMQACWTKPRVSWDTKQLDGYAAAHPEIAQFRKVGDPSVSIRWLKGK